MLSCLLGVVRARFRHDLFHTEKLARGRPVELALDLAILGVLLDHLLYKLFAGRCLLLL